MSKYRVTVSKTSFWSTEVEAGSEKEAGEIACDMLAIDENDLSPGKTGEILVSGVEKINETKI